MRKELAKADGQRKKFTAIFTRFGKKVNYKGHSEPTVLLSKITDAETAAVVADHMWFSLTTGFERAGLIPGAMLEFEARVKEYTKGYVNKKYKINESKYDYKLSHPTKIVRIKD